MLRARKGQRQMTLREDSGHLLLEAKRGIDFCPNWQLRSRPWYLQAFRLIQGLVKLPKIASRATISSLEGDPDQLCDWGQREPSGSVHGAAASRADGHPPRCCAQFLQ